MKPNWTDQQRAGIETVGHSLLVSAAAGSGKTAVLAERCAHLVCDPKSNCDVDQLLVVTFTESAAAEMKARIQEALRKIFEQNPSDHLARQVSLAEHVHASTVHGFCFRLLKQNFTLAGIDPEFDVLDPDEAMLLRQEIAGDLFNQRYEDGNEDFLQLIDAYGNGNDERLVQKVVQIHELLASLLDPQKWIDDTLASLQEAAEKPLEQSKLGRDFIQHVDTVLSGLARQCKDNIRTLRKIGSAFDPYAAHLESLSPFFAHLQQVLKTRGLDMLVSEATDFRDSPPRSPAVRGEPAGKELAQSLVKSVKNAFREKPLSDLFTMSSRLRQDGLRRILPSARALLSLVSDFTKQYTSAKAAQRAVDFADLERMTLNILRDGSADPPRPSSLARVLHDQFRHVLVDEYQDINPIQDAILRLLSRECVSEQNANLFCVGDVKQSIFRFRLAEPGRFLQRHKRFSAAADKRIGEVIHLRENFRSRAPLLEAINGVFEKLMTQEAAEIQYDQSHRLAPGKTFPPAPNTSIFTGSPIELHLLPKDPGDAEDLEPLPESEQLDRVDYEAILVARRIQQLMGQGDSPRMNVLKADKNGEQKYLPIEFSDIVILLRAMRFKADRFTEVLRAHGIEIHNEAAGGLFQATEVRDILSLLRILDNQQQDIPLATVLRSPLGALPNADDALARIRLAYPDQDDQPIPFHEAAARYATEQDDELAAHLRDFFNRLHQWRDQANKRPVAELLWHLFEQTGYLAYCGGLDDGEQRIANLLELHDRAAQFGTFLRQGLYRFLKFLESLEAEGDLGRTAAIGKVDKAVRVMSIHRSKGLEFPVVFLPDLGKEINVSDARGSILVDRQMGLAMDVVDLDRLIRYPSLASVLVSQNLLRQTVAEELRLLYVAMTRAKEHLILIATCSDKDRETWQSQWQNHAGPLPPDVIRDAQRPIDWLGPVAAATGKNIFDVRLHPAEDVRTWKNPRHNRPELSDRQKRMIRLEPLPTAPALSTDADLLIERFRKRYDFDQFTRVPATSSVTTLAKKNAETDDFAIAPLQRKLDLPRFFQKELAPKPTDIGNATHALLQYFDFATASSMSEIDRQIAGLVDRKLLARQDAALVNRDAVHWFMESELGKMIQTHHSDLIREVPFALMHPASEMPPSSDPADQIMIRGRIDLLVPTPAGLAIVDYKTDNVTEGSLDSRIEAYSRQMQFYSRAVTKVAGKKVASVYLVFLTPRRIVKL